MQLSVDVFFNRIKDAISKLDDSDKIEFYEELLGTGSATVPINKNLEFNFKIEYYDWECVEVQTDSIEDNDVAETTENDIKDVFTESEDPQPVQKCRVCGCTQERACPGGCYWVEPDLCSSCVDQQIEISFGYFKYADELSDRVQILETVGLACDFNSVEEAEAFIHGYVTALGLESAFENEAEKYPCQTIEFVISVNGNYITGFEFFYEGEI